MDRRAGQGTLLRQPPARDQGATGGASTTKSKDKVRLFTTVWCGYCKKAKAHLTAKGVPYDELDVESSEHGRSEYAKLGARGVPVILVGSQRMDGFDAAGLDAMLGQAGW